MLGYVLGAMLAQLTSVSVKCFQLSGVSIELWVHEDLDVCSMEDFRVHFNEWGVNEEGGIAIF